MALCHGPIDKLLRVAVDDKEIWSGEASGHSSIYVNLPDLFGGETKQGGIAGTFDFEPGDASQVQNDYLVSRLGSVIPAFRGVVGIVLRRMYLSMNPYLKVWKFRLQRVHIRNDGEPQWYDAKAGVVRTVGSTSIVCLNPAHIIRECLTNGLWGMGYTDGDIDDVSFQAAADTLYAEGLGMSLFWDTQTEIGDFTKLVQKHIDAVTTVNRRTGKFQIKLIRADYDVGDLLVLDKSNIVKIDDFKRPSFGELCNSVTVNYWDFTTGQTSSLTISDIALAQSQGGEINTKVDYEGFVDAETASKVAQRDLKSLSTPLATCTIYASKVARNLNIGDVFKLTWPDYGIGEMVMRVTGMAYGNGKTKMVRISCTQDAFGYPTEAYIQQPGSGWVNPNGPPTEPDGHVAFEMPYFEMVQRQGQAVVNAALAVNPEIGYAMGAAGRPLTTAAINAEFQTDNGAGYVRRGELDFAPVATLVADIDQFVDTFDITDVSNLSGIALNTWVQIGPELMGVVAVSSSSITVKRGVLDTNPAKHLADDRLYFWDEYGAADPTEYVDGESISVKILPVSGSGVYPLASATADVVDIVGRGAKPYPPANIAYNGLQFPTLPSFGDDIIITWNSRNRLTQTGGSLVGWFDGDVTVEPGVEYEVRVYDKDNVLALTYTGITATTYTLLDDDVSDYEPFIYVEVLAYRGTNYSFQTIRQKLKVVPTEQTETGLPMQTEDTKRLRLEG